MLINAGLRRIRRVDFFDHRGFQELGIANSWEKFCQLG